MVETLQRALFNHLREMTQKLYWRNPREWRKTDADGWQERVDELFDNPQSHQWRFQELDGAVGVEAIHLAFRESYEGDRVFAFAAGIGGMLMASYENKTEFFLFDLNSLDPQKLYNSARNLEIAFWKLTHMRSESGDLYLLSNEPGSLETNQDLSFERLAGKIIVIQDLLAQIVAQKTKRAIKQALQFIASSVFLPI
ncbi:putative lipoprotein [Magnetofaba australis IT-1]|uniref:Putative lipoprotein n=2 Tax=Magnetofaba TaxID=1472292 RepID=A0A1Y2K3X6_9PROT|nr:putative lipoprotein [Magnetofaba australis IT-1]